MLSEGGSGAERLHDRDGLRALGLGAEAELQPIARPEAVLEVLRGAQAAHLAGCHDG